VVSRPNYGSPLARPADLLPLLRRFCAGREHHFWTAAISLRDGTIFTPALVQGHRQLADIYLLGLAVTMKGRLVTFDRTIPVSAVKGARPESLTVIGD